MGLWWSSRNITLMIYVDTFLQRVPACLSENCWREPTETAVSRALMDVLFFNSSLTGNEGLQAKFLIAPCFGVADPDFDEPQLTQGDIAIRADGKNADPCTSYGCLWNKWTDGKAYIPYYIANHYCNCIFVYNLICFIFKILSLWLYFTIKFETMFLFC